MVDFYSKFEKEKLVRKAMKLLLSIFITGVERKDCNIKIYSFDKSLCDELESLNNKDIFEFFSVLIEKMNEYHCFVDFQHNYAKDIFENDTKHLY